MDAHHFNLDGLDLAVTDIVIAATTVAIRVISTARVAACPRCEKSSARVHSRYLRTLSDLACHERSVLIRLETRRFRCENPNCSQSIFCERLPKLAKAHARTTTRLHEAHRLVGLALGGEAGARLTEHLSIPASPDTILRRVKSGNDTPLLAPRVVGIDDWAWRKGQRYGTVVVDLERRCVIDLLPDRDAETVKAWLVAHPGVKLVSRDRSGSYAHAVTEGAPQAKQVADRWHLLKNMREAVERIFESQSKVIRKAMMSVEATTQPSAISVEPHAIATSDDSSSKPMLEVSTAKSRRHQNQETKRKRRVERFERVRDLHRQGRSIRAIARELNLCRVAVKRYIRRDSCPDWRGGPARPSGVNSYDEFIDRWLEAGGANMAELHRELVARGCRLCAHTVRRYVNKRLAVSGKSRMRTNSANSQTPGLPSAKQLSFHWVVRAEKREAEEQNRLDAIRGHDMELAATLDLADEFASLIRKESTSTLADWLSRAESSKCDELRRFAEGIRRDEASVQGAISEPWSNGPVEGHVNRLKTIKRQMYGRAGFRLLKARVLQVA